MKEFTTDYLIKTALCVGILLQKGVHFHWNIHTYRSSQVLISAVLEPIKYKLVHSELLASTQLSKFHGRKWRMFNGRHQGKIQRLLENILDLLWSFGIFSSVNQKLKKCIWIALLLTPFPFHLVVCITWNHPFVVSLYLAGQWGRNHHSAGNLSIDMCVFVRNSMMADQRISWSSLCAGQPRQNFYYILLYWLHLLGRLLNEHESSCRTVWLVSSQIPHLLVSTKYCLKFCFISVILDVRGI